MSQIEINKKSVGLVLSGGGIRGMAHIGLIKAMQEHDIEAEVISGTSVGALVACLPPNFHWHKEHLPKPLHWFQK